MSKKKERPHKRVEGPLQRSDRVELKPAIHCVTAVQCPPKVTYRVLDESEDFYILQNEKGEEIAKRKVDCALHAVTLLR